MSEVLDWVREEIGGPQLGDARRDQRFLRLITEASRHPSGRVSDAIPAGAQRQAAYDFLEHECVDVEAVLRAIARGTARQCAKQSEVLVPLDGSSLSLSDNTGLKGFGNVGATSRGGVGLKVISALALQMCGEPIGVLSQEWWARTGKAPKKSKARPLEDRESQHWHNAVERAADAIRESAPRTKLHFLIDREGDASLLMQRLVDGGHHFTIRANGTRKVLDDNGRRVSVRSFLKRNAEHVRVTLKVPAAPGRQARVARLVVRYARVRLVLRDRHKHKRTELQVHVVWAREEGTKKPIDWMLYTTSPVANGDAAKATVKRYSLRWRIEDFHRAWKGGHCDVEDTQLRSRGAVIKWATILGVVAARAEKLKHASRETPDASAADFFSQDELEAIIVLKRDEKRKNETVGDDTPTIEKAVRWLADLGGYIGPSNGPPGATVIGRGLIRIEPVAQAIQAFRAAGRLR